MNIAILCGGKGTRLQTISKGKPKVLVPIGDRPFIYILLDSLISQGFKKIFLLISFKSQEIIDELGTKYRSIPITYINDNDRLKPGTASAILNALDKLPSHFLLQYGDTILNINYKDFYKKSTSLKNEILMSIYENKNNLETNNVFYKGDKLFYFNSESKRKIKKSYPLNYIDYGLIGMHKSFLKKNIKILKKNENLKHFQEELSCLNLIYPYIARNRFYEIGTPCSYEDFQNIFSKGELKNLISPEINF